MYPVFDAHTHVYPAAISGKAIDALGKFYSFSLDGKGTLNDVMEHTENVLRGFLLFSVATTPHQVTRINDFISENVKVAREAGFEAVGYGSMHQDYEGKEAEVERMISLGLTGVKIHPDIQRAAIDDERFFPLYEAVQGRIPVYFHMGDYRKEYPYSQPDLLLRILEKFPRLQVVAAHMGGYRCWDKAIELAGHPRVWYDISSTFPDCPKDEVVKLIHTFGADRVFFGSDYPRFYFNHESDIVLSLPISEEEKRKILYENAVSFFKLNEIHATH